MNVLFGFMLWCVLLAVCWPLALLALIALPIVWLVTLPFRVGFAVVEALLAFIRGLFLLPGRMLSGDRAR